MNTGQVGWGAEISKPKDGDTGPIASWEDFERYPWPDPEGLDFSTMEDATKHMPEGMAMVGRGASL